jgi:hypothetical protein
LLIYHESGFAAAIDQGRGLDMKHKNTNCLFVLAAVVGLVFYSGAVSYATPMSVEPSILFGQEEVSGDIFYHRPSNSFEIVAGINAIEGVDLSVIVDPGFSIETSQLSINAVLEPPVEVNGIITANFVAASGIEFELIAVYGEVRLLLAGELIKLQITGEADATTGLASAIFELTDGILLDQFGSEAQLSGSINLQNGAEFSTKLFNRNFSGSAAGSINSTQSPEPVPEPGTFILLSLGCAGLIAYRKKKAK